MTVISSTTESSDTQAADEAALLSFLSNRDTPCPLCNYNLRGLTTPRCPECGRELRLTVGLTDPFMTAWITLAVFICGSAGLGILFLCVLLRAGWPHQGLVDVAIGLYLVFIPTPVVLLMTRRQFLRLPKEWQWAVTTAAGAISAAAMVVLCTSMR